MCKLIIPNMFKLMMPTDELIQQYNDFWNKEPDKICDNGWKVKLFEYGEKIDIREYINENPYEEYGQKDKEIRELWDKLKEDESVLPFLRKINTVYKTRVKNIGTPTAEKVMKDVNKKELEGLNLGDFIALQRVCSRLSLFLCYKGF